VGANAMKFRYRLPDECVSKTFAMEEFANGATQVSVRLKDGRVIPSVLISESTYVVAVRGFKDLPFSMNDIADIFQSVNDRNPTQRGGWKFWDDWKL
jgi:hypothetical protein